MFYDNEYYDDFLDEDFKTSMKLLPTKIRVKGIVGKAKLNARHYTNKFQKEKHKKLLDNSIEGEITKLDALEEAFFQGEINALNDFFFLSESPETQIQELCQSLADLFVDYFPNNWEKINFVVKNENYNMNKFSFSLTLQIHGKKISFITLLKEEKDFRTFSEEVGARLRKYYKKLPSKDRWKIMQLTIEDTGEMNLNFKY